jgi:3',5'-cyclic AMP phosphodiesterase CpdA
MFQRGCKGIVVATKTSKRIKGIAALLAVVGVTVIGLWYWRIGHISQKLQTLMEEVTLTSESLPNDVDAKPVAFRIAVLSDSHQDTQYFPDIVNKIAQQRDIDFVAHLGDLTDAGDKDKLIEAKAILDRITEPVYVLPGDHDLNWFPKHDLTNFKQVFGLNKTYFSLDHKGIHFIFIDNSNLNQGIDTVQWQWLKGDLKQHDQQPIYVFMSTPLSNPYIAYKAMGGTSDAVKTQAQQLGQLLNKYPVRATFAGDTHTFAQYTDQDSKLPIVTVGAAGSTKNLLPLYVIVEIFTDGSYNATSVPYQHAIPVTGDD